MISPFNRLSLGIGANRGGVNIPYLQDALFWLDGTILNDSGTYYFVDKTANARNFLITGYDFDSTWTKGFPYKSAATISAPVADAVLIAGDINNFLYDAGGTPNQIPVVSLFQDIDYEHKLYTRHVAQSLDSNGVEIIEPYVKDIVLYDTVKALGGVVQCEAYYDVPTEVTTNVKWVAKTGNDSTGNGSKAAPWLTFVKANASATAGDTVYVKTGVYEENSAFLAGSFYGNKSMTYIGTGGTVMQSTGANYVCYLASGDYTFKNIVIDAEDGKNTCVNLYNVGNKAVNWERCSFTRANATIYNGQSVETVTYKYCLFLGKSASATQTFATWASSIDSCYLVNCIIQISRDSSVTNNKFYANNKAYCYRVANTALIFTGNKSTYSGECITELSAFISAKNVNIKYNTFTQGDSAITRCSAVYLAGTVTLDISNNIFTSAVGDYTATNHFFIGLEDTPTPNIYNNIFISVSEKAFTHVGILVGGTVTLGACKIHDNYSKSAALTGSHMTIGYEGTSINKTDNSEFYNNRIIGYKAVNPSAVGVTVHGVLLNCGINMKIYNNYISDTDLGMVVKAGDQDTYTANGVYYNLFEDCTTSIYVRGIVGLNIVNNTIRHSDTVYGDAFANGVFADENTAKAGDQFSESIIVKNNIFDIHTAATGILVHFDAHAALTSVAENNDVYGGKYKVSVDGTGNYTTLTLAQAAGWLADSVDTDPTLTNLIPATPITGTDLGSEYDDGLDVSTVWGNGSLIPHVVTKQQPAAWQMGAYIQ